MADTPSSGSAPRHVPYVPVATNMPEFTARALIIGLVMCIVLGAANAYLGLKAGMTIAATYPAAVIGMALLRIAKGSILEENFARTVGSIGESVAAGAIFTIPASSSRPVVRPEHMVQEYLTATALDDSRPPRHHVRHDLRRHGRGPTPCSRIGGSERLRPASGNRRRGALFKAMGFGAVVKLLGDLGVFHAKNSFQVAVGTVRESFVRLGLTADAKKVTAGGVSTFSAPEITPAYLGVGYIIGPELGALNFAGGLLPSLFAAPGLLPDRR
jgi:uncharacterized oligopeptide transporter (OPT) family protein